MASEKESEEVTDLLKDITIEGVVPTGKKLGNGAFATVFAVKYNGKVCAAKQIYSNVIESATPAEKKVFTKNFLRECRQYSNLKHQNIIEFVGVYHSEKEKADRLPIMVMELMDNSLYSFVESNRANIQVKSKISILYDVSEGVNYLHTRLQPPMIHSDLTPKKVLLTSRHVAKIGNFGMAKVIDSKTRLTKNPGDVDFMPPEINNGNPVYGTAVDVFSFGGIIAYVFAEKWPTPSIQDPVTKKFVPLSEVKKREAYLDTIPEHVNVLARKCLEDNPDSRPPIQDISNAFKKLMEPELFNDLCSYMNNVTLDATYNLKQNQIAGGLASSFKQEIKFTEQPFVPKLSFVVQPSQTTLPVQQTLPVIQASPMMVQTSMINDPAATGAPPPLPPPPAPVAPPQQQSLFPLKLFISYRREDTSTFATRLYEDLWVNGYDVFFDVQSITGADCLNDAISSAIEKCDVMIVILSETYSNSDWCRKELKFAAKKKKKWVIIKRLEGECSSLVEFIIEDQLWISFVKEEEYYAKFVKLIDALTKYKEMIQKI